MQGCSGGGSGAEDGRLHTGDSGRLDEDGHLHVTGRLSERIITGGVNVDPAPVENAIRAFPGVRDAAVVGLPDPEWGERVAAAIEWETENVVRNNALDAHCRSLLSAPFRPRVFAALRLLRNPNGKVDRARVRDLLRPGEGDPSASA